MIAEFNPSETQDPMEKESRPRPRLRPRQRPISTRLDCAAVSRLCLQVSVNCVTGPDPAKPQVAS